MSNKVEGMRFGEANRVLQGPFKTLRHYCQDSRTIEKTLRLLYYWTMGKATGATGKTLRLLDSWDYWEDSKTLGLL